MTTRAPQHPRYLTPERAEMLALFATHHYLTAKDCYRLMRATAKKSGGGERTERAVRSRLKLLFDAGYLLRTPIMPSEEIIRRSPQTEYSYRLSKHGFRVATEGKFSAEKNPYSIVHDTEITLFHLELDKYPGKVYWRQRDLKKTVYPDAVFGLSKDGKSGVFFFLEIEKSRPNHYRDGVSGIIRKLHRFDKYRSSKKCKEEWELFSDFRVVVVVKTEERRRNLLAALAGILPYRFIWVTTEPEYKRDIMGKIFLTPKDYAQSVYSLLDV